MVKIMGSYFPSSNLAWVYFLEYFVLKKNLYYDLPLSLSLSLNTFWIFDQNTSEFVEVIREYEFRPHWS